jgi:hypothetical protein
LAPEIIGIYRNRQRYIYARGLMAGELVITRASPLRRRGIEAAVGGLVGIVLACLNGPGLLSLLYTPPSGDSLSCGPTVSNALAYFVKLQLVSGLIGGAFIVLVSFFIRRALQRRRDARETPAA